MKYTNLGKSNVNISRISHGCMELGGGPNQSVYWEVQDEDTNISILHTALQNGINTFDTAESYGNGQSEIIVGKALKNFRKDCIIATKVSKEHLNPNDVERSLEGSLRRLNTDYIDLYYIHWPNDEIPFEKTLSRMNRLKEQGLIRAIGVSNFSIAQIKEASLSAEISAYQPEYNLLSREIEAELLPYCIANSITIFTYNSLAKGILSGAFHLFNAKLAENDFRNAKPLFKAENMKVEEELIFLLQEIAHKHNTSISQVATKWVLDQAENIVTLIGTQNINHFEDNINATNLILSKKELSQLSEISNKTIENLII